VPAGSARDPLDPAFFALLTASHERLVGRPLVPDGADPAWLYREAPFGVLAHDGAADPRFVYANRAAQERFEYGWDELVGLPSRLSARPDARDERRRLLRAVVRDGFSTGYRGRRVTRTGRTFWIRDATVWNLVDARGARVGQAARFAIDDAEAGTPG
jgi:PAS domain S-box-containing protein